MKFPFLLFLLFVVSLSKAQSPILIFKSGYEGNSHVIQNWKQGVQDSTHADIEGIDNGWDWESTINGSPHVGFFAIRYEVLDTIAAKAEIIPELGNSSNKILSFKMSAPNVADYGGGLGKGRIQGAFINNDTLRSFFIKERLFIHEDFDFFTEPQFDSLNLNWMTIQEFWNNGPKNGEPYPFRVTLNIRKPKNSDTLYFGIHAQTQDTIQVWDNVWDSIATSYPIPLGSWLDIETYFVEGDSLNGKFKFIVTDTSGIRQTIFDITGFTHHPLDPNPDGIQDFNPMKLYTFGPYIDTMAVYNKCLCLYWDDLELWKGTETILSVTHEKINLNTLVYPNPSVNLITIEFDNQHNELFTLELFNLLGTNVRTISNISNGKILIKRKNLPSGVYFFHLYSKTYIHDSGKIIFE